MLKNLHAMRDFVLQSYNNLRLFISCLKQFCCKYDINSNNLDTKYCRLCDKRIYINYDFVNICTRVGMS